MPYYIATVWRYSVDEGEPPFFRREVIRQWANSPYEYAKHIKTEDANDECVIGPISLSKDQESR